VDKNTRGLIGSDARDAFRHWHKQKKENKDLHALDIDLVLISRDPPEPVAVIEYKLKDTVDDIKFSHGVLINWFIKQGVPVFLVESDRSLKKFYISQIVFINWLPRKIEVLKNELHTATEKGYFTESQYFQWERHLRGGEKFRNLLPW